MYKLTYLLDNKEELFAMKYDVTKGQIPIIPRVGELVSIPNRGNKIVKDVIYDLFSEKERNIFIVLSHLNTK